ncbi:MAG TPA: PglZ domain-containing protein [Syntrophorhabdus sp.]|nr:PglZ domain-containing protein [Syntrophorhabdus sp.]
MIVLLEFDPKDITYLSSFSECVEFYKKHFCKLDTAIRNLYAEFLNRKELLEPFQELYKQYVSIFLDQWFKYWSGYNENQTGTLQRIIDEAERLKTAVIVGDGVAYEIAELVAAKVKGSVNLKKDSILADIPSETENNMSRIYMANGITEAVQSNREKYLTEQNPDVSIDFSRLDEVTEESHSGQFLICTYKDIDDMGEKLQQKALKYFPETISFFAEKISLLLASGYTRVYLITDHGFVLTGLLSDADKISVLPEVPGKAKERYYISDSHCSGNGWIVHERNGEYFYFSKSMNSFKSTGAYGFSHGGVSPQELVTPYFCWERSGASVSLLSVAIGNKEDLHNVTGELFSIKIQADQGAGDLFSMDRKVYLVFFANKVQVNKSDVFTVQRDETITKEYAFDGHPEVEVYILDAATKQQLDRAVVRQNKDRDLRGLL